MMGENNCLSNLRKNVYSEFIKGSFSSVIRQCCSLKHVYLTEHSQKVYPQTDVPTKSIKMMETEEVNLEFIYLQLVCVYVDTCGCA